jgi:hypothetical protein
VADGINLRLRRRDMNVFRTIDQEGKRPIVHVAGNCKPSNKVLKMALINSMWEVHTMLEDVCQVRDHRGSRSLVTSRQPSPRSSEERMTYGLRHLGPTDERDPVGLRQT